MLVRLLFFVSFVVFLTPTIANTSIRFGSGDSSITLYDNATLDVTRTFTNRGEVRQRDNSSIIGNDIYCDFGTFESQQAPALMKGHVEPLTGIGKINLSGTASNPELFRAEPGTLVSFMTIGGTHNRIEGFPRFENPIQLADANTTVTIAIESELNQNIELNGGTIILEENLVLADGVTFSGTGTVFVNERRLEFGTKELHLTSSIYWKSAFDVYFSSKSDLSGSWTFEGNNFLNGDSTTLTLTNGGSITIRNNSSLNMRELKIVGLGSGPEHGRIYFEDDTDPSSSQLRLQRAALELTTTYTIDRGWVRAEIGSNQIITRDNFLYFEKPGRFTVQGINVFYKTRTSPDDKNIRPIDYNTLDSPIEILEDGDIVHYKTFASRREFFSSTNNGLLSKNIFLGRGSDYLIEQSTPMLDGQGWYIQFSRNRTNLLKLAKDTNATLEDVVLKDFAPYHVEFADNTSLKFTGTVAIELGENISFDSGTTWTFEGVNNFINGQEHIISFSGGNLSLNGPNAELTLQNVVLENVTPTALFITNDSAKLTFDNAKIVLAENFSISRGSFVIEGMVEVYAANEGEAVSFIYDSSSTNSSIINTASTFHFDHNVTFSYAPKNPLNKLLEFTDKSSVLSLNGATLFVTSTGLALTRGTMLVDHASILASDATNDFEAIILGDGLDADNDFDIVIMPAGSLDLVSGILLHNNVNG